jgi:repressor of nif and glnA expression
MIGQETHEVERKILTILEILSDSDEPLGGRIISRRLKEKGINLGERAVRYHLRIMDERGFTRIVGHRDGRAITQPGLEELRSALVCDKVGFVTNKIDLLAYLTTFNMDRRTGCIPIDVSLFEKEVFDQALMTMRAIYKAGLCVSDLVAVASEREKLGELVVPKGKIGLATVSSVVITGSLLKAGIPIFSRFGGLLQIRNYKPYRFVDLIEYNGSTIDPLEVFIASKMTSVTEVAKRGEGKVLASFHEIPMLSRPATEMVLEKLKSVNLCSLFAIGKTTEPICEIPVSLNNIGLILFSGLNPAAGAVEEGLNVANKAMSGVIDVVKLQSFWNL